MSFYCTRIDNILLHVCKNEILCNLKQIKTSLCENPETIVLNYNNKESFKSVFNNNAEFAMVSTGVCNVGVCFNKERFM